MRLGLFPKSIGIHTHAFPSACGSREQCQNLPSPWALAEFSVGYQGHAEALVRHQDYAEAPGHAEALVGYQGHAEAPGHAKASMGHQGHTETPVGHQGSAEVPVGHQGYAEAPVRHWDHAEVSVGYRGFPML